MKPPLICRGAVHPWHCNRVVHMNVTWCVVHMNVTWWVGQHLSGGGPTRVADAA